MLMLFAAIRGVPMEGTWAEVHSVARIFGLEDQLNTAGRHLTSFCRRTLTLAIAFVGSPSLIILDDPTNQVHIL